VRSAASGQAGHLQFTDRHHTAPQAPAPQPSAFVKKSDAPTCFFFRTFGVLGFYFWKYFSGVFDGQKDDKKSMGMGKPAGERFCFPSALNFFCKRFLAWLHGLFQKRTPLEKIEVF
jgi:hypothetical protein